MSRIAKLINELCPRGVPYKPLANPDVAQFRTGNQLNRSTLSDDGEYPVYNGGIAPSGRHSEYNTEGPTSIVSQGGASAGFVNFVETPFWAGAHCYVVRPCAALDLRFLYYVLKSKQSTIQAAARGAGIPGLARGALGQTLVPVPPVKVQREIVSTLDQFTALEAELNAELEARSIQYAHYSKLLLHATTDTIPIDLGDAISSIIDHRGKTPKKLGGDWSEKGHRVVSALNIKGGRVDDNDHHYIDDDLYRKWMRDPLQVGDVLLTSEAPLGELAYIAEEVDWAVGQRVFGLRPRKDVLDARYLYHALRAGPPRSELLARATGSTVSGIRQSELLKVRLHMPDIGRQREIAEILDAFESLTNDHSVGLPAELRLRRKQYEYYRDKLLTFEELSA